ncbi:hypothetical protein A5645_22395 [Mycobacterium asiaticum]|uniref:hypothetical protein n=1 Tax=Mycobacterium asiaticum TaxID=1790 RepID=UPI0007EF5775|nr:hypothetical protein [Mycobacterium asiaticum]OBK92761.1 hypothetical protein A5645_22395 [Mycobacterium asiaticum]
MIQSIAVVNAATEKVALWHVAVDNETAGMSRMCGAWVLDDEPHKVELLTRDRYIVATPAGAEALRSAKIKPAGMLDLTKIVDAVTAERDRLQSIYDALPTSRKKTLVAPRWPYIPFAIDLASPPMAQVADATVAITLGVARFLEQLATAWADVERQRTARDYLTEGTGGHAKGIRDLPLEILSESIRFQ